MNLAALRNRTLRRLAGAVRRPQRISIDPGLPAPPRERREMVWGFLEPHLRAQEVHFARDSGEPGAVVAVLRPDLANVHRALVRAAAVHPDLWAHLYRENRQISRVPIGGVTLAALESMHWVGIGLASEIGPYEIGPDGHLTILVVERDPERNRLLALHSRTDRVDWTEVFPALAPQRPPSTATTPRPRPDRALDVVYTWVDSEDPVWRQTYDRYSSGHEAANVSADNDERYANRDELRYSLRSIWMFLPLVRKVYLVTAGQRPSWLADHPQVSVVSHGELFPDPAVLPTFNSHAIETCLHRIPGLSENFLYFNDDVFIGREVAYSDFFTLAGLAKVRLSPSAYIYHGRPEQGAIPTDWAAYNSVSLIERDFSIRFERRLQHVPLPLNKSVLDELEQKYSYEVAQTRAARFRSPSDVAIPSMFGQYYAMAIRRAVEWPSGSGDYVYLNTGRTSAPKQYATIMTRRPKFFCLNATRYNEITLTEQARQVTNFMRTAFPAAAPWER